MMETVLVGLLVVAGCAMAMSAPPKTGLQIVYATLLLALVGPVTLRYVSTGDVALIYEAGVRVFILCAVFLAFGLIGEVLEPSGSEHPKE